MAELIADEITRDGQLGVCIDASMMMTKMLEEEAARAILAEARPGRDHRPQRDAIEHAPGGADPRGPVARDLRLLARRRPGREPRSSRATWRRRRGARPTTRRSCLRCRRSFDSHGLGNRLCEPCRLKSADASLYAE